MAHKRIQRKPKESVASALGWGLFGVASIAVGIAIAGVIVLFIGAALGHIARWFPPFSAYTSYQATVLGLVAGSVLLFVFMSVRVTLLLKAMTELLTDVLFEDDEDDDDDDW